MNDYTRMAMNWMKKKMKLPTLDIHPCGHVKVMKKNKYTLFEGKPNRVLWFVFLNIDFPKFSP